MKTVNLYELSRLCDPKIFEGFERSLSEREENLVVKQHELVCLRKFVDQVIEQSGSINIVDNFYFSYKIPQIGKEFDLLHICDDFIINIELKSGYVDQDKIKKQLVQNRYYLSHISKNIMLVTYISETNEIFELKANDELFKCDFSKILACISSQEKCSCKNIDSLFRVSNYLVSPINNTERFFNEEYFLTEQQQNIRRKVLHSISTKKNTNFISIKGGAGTGKTLLLYDLARTCSIAEHCIVVHCGILSNGHNYLNTICSSIEIMSAKDFAKRLKLGQPICRLIFVDESQRFYENQFLDLVEYAKSHDTTCIFSYDVKQVLQQSEMQANIDQKIKNLPSIDEYALTGKIRTNRELVSFIRRFINLKDNDIRPFYSSVSILYADTSQEAIRIIDKYQALDYAFISFTASTYKSSSFDVYGYGNCNTHAVVGQEFDNVIVVMDSTFSYNDEGILSGRYHPNRNYIYAKLVYQAITRVRESLTIVVVDNLPLFQTLLKIKGSKVI